MTGTPTRELYFGDNLEMMRQHVSDESVDLVYLDPPFNSNQTYNVLFKTDDARPSHAQMEAFDDTWHWTPDTQAEWQRLVTGSEYDVPPSLSKGMDALRIMLGENDVMAYLVMMAPRLLEIHRVLKPTGSMYLHCDPTASHYLKVICDQIFEPQNFRSEIVWKRTSAHSDSKQGRTQHGRIHDSILFYTKTSDFKWNTLFTEYDSEYVKNFYRHVEPGTDRIFRLSDMTGPGGAAKGNPQYEVMGVTRYWRFSEERMKALVDDGRVVQTKPGNVPQQKRYLDEMSGVPLQDIWTDIKPIGAQATERLGYPTQKPTALLERIIESSTDEGDIVLDPFCGCGTAVSAAEKLRRSWIGIDVTYLAIALIEQRLQDNYPGIVYKEHGSPKDVSGAKALFEGSHKNFEMWAVRQIGGRPNPKGGGDQGTDGIISFLKDGVKDVGTITVSVKGGETVNPSMVRDLIGTVEKDGTEMGILITRVEPTKGMLETATKAGVYRWPFSDTDYPKIQIVAVPGLLDGERPDMPIEHGTLAKAPLVEDTGKQLNM